MFVALRGVRNIYVIYLYQQNMTNYLTSLGTRDSFFVKMFSDSTVLLFQRPRQSRASKKQTFEMFPDFSCLPDFLTFCRSFNVHRKLRNVLMTGNFQGFHLNFSQSVWNPHG